MFLTLLAAAFIVAGLLFVSMNILDPLLSRLGEIRECLMRLENIRRIQKEMHEFGYEWWMQELMRKNDELMWEIGSDLPRYKAPAAKEPLP